MPVNLFSFDTPSTKGEIERRKAYARVLSGNKQKVDHPLQAVSNAAGDIAGAFMTKQAYAGEDARSKAMADALRGVAPAGLDPRIYGALIEDNPEAAMELVAKSQLDAAGRTNERDEWKWRKDYEQSLDPPGTFDGNGLDAQAWNILQTADPSSKEYATAHAIVSQPKTQLVPTPDGLVPMEVAPTLPAWLQPPTVGAPPPPTGAGDPAAPAPVAQPLPKIGGPDEPMPQGAQPPVQAVPTAPPPPEAAQPAQPAGPVIPPVVVPPAPAVAPNQGGIKVGEPIPGTQPKMGEGEANAATFADRLLESGAILEEMGTRGSGQYDQIAGSVPYVGGYLTSEDYQKVDQAKRNFINAQLRRESGATIQPHEFENADKQYFPQPTDGPDLLEQKRRNRQTVIDGMIRAAGATYKPKPPVDAGGDIPTSVPNTTIRRR